ncbi:hypothetical protein GCM10025794_07750 [Massilia kyonggiensis]
MPSDSLDNPVKALGVAGTALDAAALLKAGSGGAALASGVAGLAGHASPQLAQALQVASQAHSLAQNVDTLAGHAATPVEQSTAPAEHLAIEEHPLAGQAVSDFAGNEPQYVPPNIDPAAHDDAASAVAALLAKFNDGKRLLRFYSPLQGEKTLLIESLSGSSAMSDQFVFNLSLISENAAIDLKDLMGKNVSVGVQLADGSEHFINGYVHSFGFSHSDGGFAFYHAQIVPWLSYLKQGDPHGIEVEGFTDNTPIGNPAFASNWELSAVRATTVVRLFAANGVAEERLAAVGRGANRPIASNDDPVGRARNRRVAVTILSGAGT